jgi:hypothetical protein
MLWSSSLRSFLHPPVTPSPNQSKYFSQHPVLARSLLTRWHNYTASAGGGQSYLSRTLLKCRHLSNISVRCSEAAIQPKWSISYTEGNATRARNEKQNARQVSELAENLNDLRTCKEGLSPPDYVRDIVPFRLTPLPTSVVTRTTDTIVWRQRRDARGLGSLHPSPHCSSPTNQIPGLLHPRSWVCKMRSTNHIHPPVLWTLHL